MGTVIVLIVFLIAFIAGAIEGLKKTNEPKCPSCGARSQRLGPITRMEYGSGGLGKSHICKACGRLF